MCLFLLFHCHPFLSGLHTPAACFDFLVFCYWLIHLKQSLGMLQQMSWFMYHGFMINRACRPALMPVVRQRLHMYLLFSFLRCAVIHLSQTEHLSLRIWAVLAWQMSPSLSAGTVSEEVQISAHTGISNHAWHLDERQALITWLTGMLTWEDCWHRNTKTAGFQSPAWHTDNTWTHGTNQCTLTAHLPLWPLYLTMRLADIHV